MRRMAILGEVFTAAEALSLGLVDAIAAKGKSLEAARDMARALPRAVLRDEQATKMLINAAEGEESERVLEAIAGTMAAASAELKEGVAAFRERRKPRF